MRIRFSILVFIFCLAVVSNNVIAQKESNSSKRLEDLFRNPPTSVKPYVWWHWMGSNFSKEGITKDLEAMKAEGIGGATIFNLSSAVQESHYPTLNNPWPEQTYRSPSYWEALRYAAAEAERLGLEIGLHNTVGYSTTGGPWIDEERSMQRLVWSENSRISVSLRLKGIQSVFVVFRKTAGVLWYPPYTADITSLLQPDDNRLEILVTTNWANRLIGDEQEPADFEWGKDRGEKMGRAMLAYPDWFVKDQPRPSQGRKTFSIWYYYRKESPLKPAGLVGPVRLVYDSEVKL